MNKILIVTGIALVLGACSPSADDVSNSSFDGEKIAYFKDYRTGLCFSMTAVSRMDSGGKWSSSVSHSNVPCTPEVEKLLRNIPKTS